MVGPKGFQETTTVKHLHPTTSQSSAYEAWLSNWKAWDAAEAVKVIQEAGRCIEYGSLGETVFLEEVGYPMTHPWDWYIYLYFTMNLAAKCR